MSKVIIRSQEYANESVKNRNENLSKFRIKDNIINDDVLCEMVSKPEELKIDIQLQEDTKKTPKFHKLSLIFNGKTYKNPVFKLTDSKTMKYHEQYGNGSLMIRTDSKHEQNIYKLLELINTEMKSVFSDVNPDKVYTGLASKYKCFKSALPEHKYKINDKKSKPLYDFKVQEDDNVYSLVIDPAWVDEDSDETGTG